MEARAILRYAKISPRKSRQVVDLVRGKGVEEALKYIVSLGTVLPEQTSVESTET